MDFRLIVNWMRMGHKCLGLGFRKCESVITTFRLIKFITNSTVHIYFSTNKQRHCFSTTYCFRIRATDAYKVCSLLVRRIGLTCIIFAWMYR